MLRRLSAFICRTFSVSVLRIRTEISRELFRSGVDDKSRIRLLLYPDQWCHCKSFCVIAHVFSWNNVIRQHDQLLLRTHSWTPSCIVGHGNNKVLQWSNDFTFNASQLHTKFKANFLNQTQDPSQQFCLAGNYLISPTQPHFCSATKR